MRKILLLGILLSATLCVSAAEYNPSNSQASLSLKIPGNNSTEHPLTITPEANGNYRLTSEGTNAVAITQRVEKQNGQTHLKTTITAQKNIYFHYKQAYRTGYSTDDCQYLLPGFWYRRNMRSPKESPSYAVSNSWNIREDRLSSPYCAIYNEREGKYTSVMRLHNSSPDALTTHREGEVILSGSSSLGFVGFKNEEGESALTFGYPYEETPKSYIRKLTLINPIIAFQELKKGETIDLCWTIAEGSASDFADVVKQSWEHCYDITSPKPVEEIYPNERMKEVLSNFFVESYVDNYPLKYYSGEGMRVADCESIPVAEVGFVGRVLLNAFNAYEYGTEQRRTDLRSNAKAVFDSYLTHGFSTGGFIIEKINLENGDRPSSWSIRRQSEGIYAILHYLKYERERKQKHPEWEKRVKSVIDRMVDMQNQDGSFPRKFKDDGAIDDPSKGSTPCATLPLVLASKYFNDKRYLEAAKRSIDYLEREIISKSDYFSSTLDANCEDKEAALYSSTASYYMALVSKGEEQKRYAELSRRAAYFALSWYYTWDVPFATGQMLGDLGLKSRGWGNVSVENNHIDVYIFEFNSTLEWLSKRYNEPRFSNFAQVISSSMRQLLPLPNNLCGIAKAGYYPEVVQHTNWDYGKNGKGFYNDIFAPGWTVASLWEMLTPGRSERFLEK